MQLLSVTVLLTVTLLCKAASIGTLDGGSTIPQNGAAAQQAGGSETTTVKSDGSTAMKSSDTAKGQSTLEELVKQVFASDDSTGQKPKLVTVSSTAADLTTAHTDTAVISGDGGSTIPKLQENEMKTTSTASVPSTGVVYNYLESTLVQKGFVKCYDQPYSHYTSSADLNACAGSEFVFVGAKSSSNANVFSIGAFGASVNVFKNTYSTSQAYYDAVGGAYCCDFNNPDCSHRLCFHLDQPFGGYRAGCTVGLNGDSTWRKVIYKSSLPTCGVQYDYKESDLIQKGYVKCYEQPYTPTLLLLLAWPHALDQIAVPSCGVLYNYPENALIQKSFTKCYDQPYSHATTSADLANCMGSSLVFVGAKSSAGSNTFALGAFGVSSNILKTTSSATQAYIDDGGAYWYRYPGRSFGFASSSSVNLNSCDYNIPDCSHRLCFHLDQNVGGYRAGCTVGLNGDSTWRKVIYKGNYLNSCSPGQQ
ncbi:hypothetical protein EMCRGX_G007301 [Ephydatia muelleri]